MKKLISTILLTLIVGISALSFATIVSADDGDTNPEETTTEESTSTSAPEIPKPDFLPGPSNTEGDNAGDYVREQAIPSLISVLIGFTGIVAFVALIIGGVQFLTAFGNDEQVGAAKKTITYALVGFVVAILSYAIVSIVSSVPLGETNILGIPHAGAIEVSDLLPSEDSLISNSPNAEGASLPSGDFGEDIIPAAIRVILYASSAIIMVALVYAGINLVIAQGNEEAIKKSQNVIIYTIVGIITIAISYAVIYGISRINF